MFSTSNLTNLENADAQINNLQSKIQDSSGIKCKKAFQDVKNHQQTNDVLQNNGASKHIKFGGKVGYRQQSTADMKLSKPESKPIKKSIEIEDCNFFKSGGDFHVFSPYSLDISTKEIDEIFNRSVFEPELDECDWNESAIEHDLFCISPPDSPTTMSDQFLPWNDSLSDSGFDLELNSTLPDFNSTLSDDLPLPDFDWNI